TSMPDDDIQHATSIENSLGTHNSASYTPESKKRKYSKYNDIDNQYRSILVPSIGFGNTSTMNPIQQTSHSTYLQFTTPHDSSTTFNSSNLLTYNSHQTWSSNDDNSNSSIVNKTTRRRNQAVVNNGPKRPVGRPPKKLQQQRQQQKN
ncbi:unnamed protein product, partial [Rotaria magnacalcarata]